ncbi:MAG: phosphoribosyl-AMP cyclohydrolase [Pseudomonadota bacterium]
MSDIDKKERETGRTFSPRFDAQGLLTCVTLDHASSDVLMVAHMNAEAVDRTIQTGVMHYWSRSRQELWKKGETSGQIQTVVELRTDCDQDAIVARVTVGGDGGACHTGERSCFFRRIITENGVVKLERDESA